MFNEFAPKITFKKDFSIESELVVENGEPITVYGLVATSSAGIDVEGVEVRDNDDNLIMSLGTIIHSFVYPSVFVAYNGLKIVATIVFGPEAGLSISVFHSHSGA